MNNLELLLEITTSALTSFEDPTTAVAFLCMMFDHVCETYDLDKEKTLGYMCKSIVDINKFMGNMYGKENQYEH